MGRERYATAVAAEVRPTQDGAAVVVAVGGNPPPLLLRAGGTTATVGGTGPIVGWDTRSVYRSETAALSRGDTLVLFTDGLLEAVAGHGETDDAALREVIAPLAGRPPEEVAAALDAAMAADRRDDAAFLVARVG